MIISQSGQFPVGLQAQLVVACVGFWRTNYHAKNGGGKRGPGGEVGGGRGGKKKLADKLLNFENRSLGLSRLSAQTETSHCHRLS